MLRAVTLRVKFSRDHSGVMRSRKIFEPFAGGFGSSREAGFSRSSRDAAAQAGTTALTQASANATAVMAGWNASAMRGTVNPVLYAWSTMSGSSV